MREIAKKILFIASLISSLFPIQSGMTKPATEIAIDSETNKFENREISSGSVRVLVDYREYDFDSSDESSSNNLSYKIFYEGKLQIEKKTSTVSMASVFLQDLDNNGVPEAIIRTFSGGAHCCTSHTIYTWQEKQFNKTEIEYLDGIGGSFQDLNNDKIFEFVTYDNSFLYTFSSYAGSFPPSRIYTFQNGKLENVTRQFPQKLQATLKDMQQAFNETKKQGYEVNGVLAGYVAQKILLGDYEGGWQFMLKNYDRTSEWGLEIYEGDRQVGTYPDFPSALKAFLIRTKYLNSNGKPYQN
jgi:hypothetical protein